MKTRMLKPAALGIALLPLIIAGCERTGLFESSLNSESTLGGLSATRDMNQFPLHKVVCDPWSGGGGSLPDQGVRARKGKGQQQKEHPAGYGAQPTPGPTAARSTLTCSPASA